jgi:hypothetical protein
MFFVKKACRFALDPVFAVSYCMFNKLEFCESVANY